jgi:hypothetical protein
LIENASIDLQIVKTDLAVSAQRLAEMPTQNYKREKWRRRTALACMASSTRELMLTHLAVGYQRDRGFMLIGEGGILKGRISNDPILKRSRLQLTMRPNSRPLLKKCIITNSIHDE